MASDEHHVPNVRGARRHAEDVAVRGWLSVFRLNRPEGAQLVERTARPGRERGARPTRSTRREQAANGVDPRLVRLPAIGRHAGSRQQFIRGGAYYRGMLAEV